jgi:hypothetical protein
MKRWVMLLVVVMAVSPMARADEASKKAKVEELFATMHMDRMMSQITAAMLAQVKQMTATMPGADQMTAAQKKMVSEYQDKMAALVTANVGWRAMEPEYVTLYASTFSEEEIDGIIAFYKSPAGQALLTKTPELTKGSMALVQTRMVDLQPQMKAMVDEMVQQMSAGKTGAAAKPMK